MQPFRSVLPPLVCLTLLAAGCGGALSPDGSPEPLRPEEVASGGISYEQFLSLIYQEPDTGLFIVDGDTPIGSEKELQAFYERYVRQGQLIIHQNGGVDAKWDNTQKLNLTYCVSTTFGTRHSQVVQSMASATGAWEAAANVNFVYVSAQDGSCTASNTNVLFDVRPVNTGGQYLARAFFPGETRANRNILIDDSAFTTQAPPDLTGILRHELGHVLGFRHEHTRPEAGTCFEDNSWRALTTYDSNSVMHYPQCNGTGDWTLVLTDKDKAGAVSVYGSPGGGTPPPSGTTTENFSGSVAQGEQDSFGPFSVSSGTTFSVTMSGTGDADLYVRFGSAPTTSSYDCRPYKSGSSESCSLTVPAGQSTAYVMVRGYTSATYSLTVTYVKPSSGGGNTRVENFSGSVATGEQDNFGPFSVVAGTTFKVVMSGSGDPDLYVRFGAAPTTSSYNCRPYLSGAGETCTLTVPSGQSSAYVMVRGYSSASYGLEVTYTAP